MECSRHHNISERKKPAGQKEKADGFQCSWCATPKPTSAPKLRKSRRGVMGARREALPVKLELSPTEQKIWDARNTGNPVPLFREIAEEMGVTQATAKRTYYRAKRKIADRKKAVNYTLPNSYPGNMVENKRPEDAAIAIDAVTNPLFDNVAKLGRELKIAPSTLNALIGRLNADYQPLTRELKRIKTDTLVKQFENLATDALASITKEDIEAETAYKRTIMAAIATEKRELLDGRPTERITHEDRRRLPELVEALLDEAGRRGFMKQIDPVTGKASLTRPEGQHPQVRMGKKRPSEVVDAEYSEGG